MSQSLQRLRILYFSAAALTAIGLVLRTLSLFLAFDRDIGYFAADAFCPVLLYAIEAVSILWFFSFFIFCKKDTLPGVFPVSGLTVACGRGFAALTAVAASVFLFIFIRNIAAPAVIPVFAALLLLSGSVYLLFPVFGINRQTAQLLSGYALIFASALLLSLTYFDRYTQMNAPHKVGQHLALLSVMMVLVCQLRVLIDRARPRAGAVFTCISFFLCTVIGGSGVIAAIGGVYSDPVYFAIDLLLLGFAVYLATGTLGVFLRLPQNGDGGAPDEADEPAETETLQ